MDIRRILIVAGIVLLVAGLLWPFLTRLGLGRLPGDIVVERENFRFYFPLVTSILVSIVLTALFWLFRAFSAEVDAGSHKKSGSNSGLRLRDGDGFQPHQRTRILRADRFEQRPFARARQHRDIRDIRPARDPFPAAVA